MTRLTLTQISTKLQALEQRGTADALTIGFLLTQAKNRLSSSNAVSFGEWLKRDFVWSQRTADRFMRARRWYDGQPKDIRHCVDSGLTVTALYVVSADNTPADAQKAILATAKLSRVGGSTARKIVADMREPVSEPEAGPEPGSNLAAAIAVILACNPQEQDLVGFDGPTFVRAADVLSQLAHRVHDGDPVKIAADRAEARSAAQRRSAKAA